MKKYIFCFTLVITTLLAIFTTTAFAQTTTVVIKPEYTEDTVVAINFKDGQLPGVAEYVYTGKKIMPEVVVTKTDNTIADPAEYIITYDDNCDELGAHFITVEYLKSGYKVAMDYRIVPGKTTKVDMTAKNGSVTLSWSAVKGATHYEIQRYVVSKKKWVTQASTKKNYYTKTKLSRKTSYKFRVRAIRGSGKSRKIGSYSKVYKKSTI